MAINQRQYLYRILHIDNLEKILESGKLTSPTHQEANPNYIGIGDATLKQSRRGKPIIIEPFGTFSDYVAFYFGYRSPMLYNIKNGYQGVTKRPQGEIIYLVTSIQKVVELNLNFVFFDGHGYHGFSQAFNDIKFLDKVDWDVVKANQWFDTEEDPDRKRRKQAEFLIKDELPLEGIIGVGTYDEKALERVNELLDDYLIDIKSVVMSKWYY